MNFNKSTITSSPEATILKAVPEEEDVMVDLLKFMKILTNNIAIRKNSEIPCPIQQNLKDHKIRNNV